MGIRVHKRLGYGFKNLRIRRDRGTPTPNDPRWDYVKYVADWREPGGDGTPEKEQTLEQFLTWVQDNKARLVALAEAEGWPKTYHWLLTEGLKDRIKNKRARTWTAPYDAVGWEMESGLPRVVLFQCPSCPDWSRYDDTIDYYEESTLAGPKVRATFLRPSVSGIYPFEGHIHRFREPSEEVRAELEHVGRRLMTGEEMRTLDHTITTLDGGTYNRLVGYWSRCDPEIKDPAVLRHFREDWRPQVPVGILAVIEYLGCFPDAFGPDGIVNSLRPMVYVYWG